MKNGYVNIAVGEDIGSWHDKFSDALLNRQKEGYPLRYKVINMETRNWVLEVTPFDVVIWKPSYMGPESALHFKEKVYFLEHHLGKLVVPNYETIWHFESKIAQSYIFQSHRIWIPSTTVSFDYHDAISALEQTRLPIVFKESHGAGGQNVYLVKEKLEAKRSLLKIFCHQLWREETRKRNSKIRLYLSALDKRWFWFKLIGKILGDEFFKASYWQEFVSQNDKDLRITVIGDRYAFGFWRKNRPNDFRASGSGLIDYQLAIPEGPLRYCLKINKELNFDSMAYDILFNDEGFVITEMSYSYSDSAIQNSGGHYELQEDDKLVYVEGHVWPQEFWIEWALHRIERDLGGPTLRFSGRKTQREDERRVGCLISRIQESR